MVVQPLQSLKNTQIFKLIVSSRVGLILDFLRYQSWSLTSENTMSEDSKNVFRIDVSHIETHCKPIKLLVSIVYHSREAENFFASKMAEMNFLLYKMRILDPILKKLSFYLP